MTTSKTRRQTGFYWCDPWSFLLKYVIDDYLTRSWRTLQEVSRIFIDLIVFMEISKG